MYGSGVGADTESYQLQKCNTEQKMKKSSHYFFCMPELGRKRKGLLFLKKYEERAKVMPLKRRD
ncbi:hypothetical protein AA15669_0930 [Saccharibacter floricola DSM 15669]|uniref:Uncharacterized protein n=1 Tax=Saccharibacter floricola DSM 15669 TaxID=1123227 RepID=A0ABQ0P1R7_9PROT|nr:hypothetical protein AA15669_0930 [Saccharibacter floricola DSM 15669]